MSELIQIIDDTVKSLTTGLVKTIQGMFIESYKENFESLERKELNK